MSSAVPRIWPSMPVLRAILATLALVSQLTLGAFPAQARHAATEAAQLRAVTILCHGQPSGAGHPAAPHRQRAPDDQTGCPLDLALELPAVILTPAILLPRPGLPTTGRPASLPTARAPPARFASALHARAPPDPA